VISGFRPEVDENCALLGYYAAISGKSVPTFRRNLSGPIFKGQEIQELTFFSLEDGPIGCPETSVRNYQYLLRNKPEKRSSHLLGGGSLSSDVRVLWLCVIVRSFHDVSWQYSVTPAIKTGPNTKITLTKTFRTD
jgi:hypothetical protein